jgi:gliding motility-associated-like protein
MLKNTYLVSRKPICLKKIFLLFSVLFYSIDSFSQVLQEYIGKTGGTSFANTSAVLNDGKTVVAGVTTSGSGDNDALITCFDPSGAVLWSKEVATSGNDRFISVTATADGGCVAAGYVASTLSSPFLNTQAAVYKFDNTGSVVWNKIIEASSYGEVFLSVIEIPGSNNIVCAGVYSFGGAAAGMIINFSAAGVINWAKSYQASSQTLLDIKHLNGNIICAGIYNAGSDLDGRIFSVKESNGNVNWNRTYDYTSTSNPSVNSNFFDRINIVQDKIYIDAFISPNYGIPSPTLSITPSLMSVDTTGLNPFCLEYPVGSSSYVNVIHSNVVSKNEIYLFQHPAPYHWERIYSVAPLKNITDVICIKIKDITNAAGSLVYVRKLGTTGEQGLTHSHIIGGKIVAWGGANNDPTHLTGTQDFFKLEADTALPVTATNCIENATGQKFSYPTVSINPTSSFSGVGTISLLTPEIPTVTSVSHIRKTPCKTGMTPDFSNTRTACFTIDFKDLSTKGATGFKSWNWSFGDGSTSSVRHPVHIYAAPGTYPVKLILTDSSGDKDSITKMVSVVAYRFLTAGNDTNICSSSIPGNVLLRAHGGKIFSWTPAAGLSNPSIATPVASVTGSVKYVVTATDSLGCINKDSTIITVRTADVNIAPDSVKACEGADVLLKASGASKYKWTPATGLTKDTGATPAAHVTKTVTYKVTGTDVYGCQDLDSVKITMLPPAHVTALQDTVHFCPGTNVQLDASGALRYKWYSDNIDYGDSSAAVTLEPGFSQYIKVKGWNAEGCFAIDSAYLSQRSAPNVKIITKDPVVGCNKGVELEASGAQNYSWWPAAYSSNSSGQSTEVYPPNSMWMQVQGVDSLGCKGTDSVWVSFDGKSLVLIPSAFTPNNDNFNDRIKPIIVCNFTVGEFAIYNRWGQLVFSGQSNNSAWDGTMNGKPCELGVYYYFLKGRDQNNTEIMLKGDITLIR